MVPWIFSILVIQIISCNYATSDPQNIPYIDLLEGSHFFHEPDVISYSQLLFDVARQQVIVGARDNLFRLSAETLQKLERGPWPTTSDNLKTCQIKGQKEENCHNYVKVLLSNGTNLFTCGTNAFNPICTLRDIQNIRAVIATENGKVICPYSPHANVTSLLSSSPPGGLYTATTADFSGSDFGIFKSSLNNGLNFNLRTYQWDMKWLNNAQFVATFETDKHVYFLFRETAVEHINCGKKIFSRIARVCKSDPGGEPVIKYSFTSFNKARLNCSRPGEFPFYYDEIQGAVYDRDQEIVYGIFTTPRNGVAGSAICAFNMSTIIESFDGDFKDQKNHLSTWNSVKVNSSNRMQCDGNTESPMPNDIINYLSYQLMDKAVKSSSGSPLWTVDMEWLTHIAIDQVQTKKNKVITVIYVANTDGMIRKISRLPQTRVTCSIETWGPIPSSILTMQFFKGTNSLYVGTNDGVLRLPADRCSRHSSQSNCLNAMDPYCGFNQYDQVCTTAPDNNPNASFWTQELRGCPMRNPIQGGWTCWGPWGSCSHLSDSPRPGRQMQPQVEKEENMDKCLCSVRICNNPKPEFGGADCKGPSVRVTNCTVHGGWTPWSAWSACSNTCGFAIKTRKRSCTNPTPAFGGRVCIGHDYDEAMCINLPPCPNSTKPPELPQNGQWSQWSAWGDCSRVCNGGHRIRTRTCNNPPPSKDGLDCPGCSFQIEECNAHPCPETRKYSGWTPWLTVNSSQSATTLLGYTERRFRFNCRAQTEDPLTMKIQVKEEERYCRSSGSCVRGTGITVSNLDNSIDGWSEWSTWSICNKSCDTGSQFRVRTCETRSCEGSAIEHRECNTNSCLPNDKENGQWSCWTDWSECSVTCGVGIHYRTRECLGENCLGSKIVRETCQMPSCESLYGWDSWSRWSSCNGANQQQRTRKCLQPNVCQGHNLESRDCFPEYLDNEIVNALPRSDEMSGVSVGAIIGSSILGFIIGLGLTAVLCVLYIKHHSKPRIPCNPHYITKQNSYVTVPMKEVSTKRTPSFSGITNGNGTLRGKSNGIGNIGSPKLYPKSLEYESATLKRNSHGQTINRAELEQEKYY